MASPTTCADDPPARRLRFVRACADAAPVGSVIGMTRRISYRGVPEARQEGTQVAFSGEIDLGELLKESRSTMWSKRSDGWYVTEGHLVSHDPSGDTIIEITSDTDYGLEL